MTTMTMMMMGRQHTFQGHGDEDDDDHDDDHRRRSGKLILVRNHEPAAGTPYLQNRPDITYASDGAGGTTNLIFDARKGKWLRAWSTLAGTIRNCAGGVTPWGTWITNEETPIVGHGWNFEVGPTAGNPKPIVSMGRFSHEANMCDPATGYVYETEDSDLCGFYKFVPHRRGRLHSGGRLYMLRVRNEPNADLGVTHPIGTSWKVDWVRIDDPLAADDFVLRAGRGERRSEVPPVGGRLVGRSHGLTSFQPTAAPPSSREPGRQREKARCSSTTRVVNG